MKRTKKSIENNRYQSSFASKVESSRTIFQTVFSGFFYTSLMLLMLIVVLWFFRQMNDPTKFTIRQIEFTTPTIHLNSNVLKKISLPFIKQNFFRVNIFALKKRLDALPWVYETTVLRSWPNGLAIRIKEQEAVARLPKNKLLNKQLEVFSVPPATVPTGLPEFNGPAGQLPVMWQNYRAIEAILNPIKLHVVYFELSERQSWRLRLDNGLKLILGRQDGLDHLRRFVDVYYQIMTPQNIGIIDSIDLRYSNGMSVHSQQGVLKNV